MTIITLEPKTSRAATPHRVFLRGRWHDEWTRIPWLFAEQVAWRLAPGLSTAALTWQYGYGMRQGEITPAVIQRLTDRRRQYVKIEIDAHALTADERQNGATPLRWYGTIELDARVSEGLFAIQNGEYVQRGDQPLAAVGLEQALYRHPIRGATFLDSDGGAKRAGRPFIFNKPNAAGEPIGNQSTARGDRSYLFSSQVYGEDSIWTPRTVVEYLIANEVPKGRGGGVEWTLLVHENYQDFLPNWGQPVIDPRDRTTGQLLDLLMPRSRMLSWFLQVDTSQEGEDTVKLIPVSLFGSIVATDLGNLPANPIHVRLQTTASGDGSPELIYQLKESDIARVDQVRVLGARRTSTGTLTKQQNTIDKGWSDDLQTEFETAYSAAAGYGSLSKAAKQIGNAEIRESDRLRPVFRRFAIPAAWDQTVKDADGNTAILFPDDPDFTKTKRLNPREIELAPTLALVEGFDYSDVGNDSNRIAPVKVYDSGGARLPALVIFQDPTMLDPDDEDEAPRYMQVEKIGVGGRIPVIEQKSNRAWSGRVEIPLEDRAVQIHVQGQPQQVLAFGDFLPLDDGTEEDLGEWKWNTAFFTVTIYDDRFAEGVYPDDAAADLNVVNTRRELLVDAGSAYRLDWLAKDTVIGIDPTTRALKRSAGLGWINDDRKQLAARARQIYEYYGQTRRALILDTRIITSQLQLGYYVESFGRSGSEREVGTVITSIELTIPGGTDPAPSAVRYSTAVAELEPAELLNRPHVKFHATPEHVPIRRIGAAGPVRP